MDHQIHKHWFVANGSNTRVSCALRDSHFDRYLCFVAHPKYWNVEYEVDIIISLNHCNQSDLKFVPWFCLLKGWPSPQLKSILFKRSILLLLFLPSLSWSCCRWWTTQQLRPVSRMAQLLSRPDLKCSKYLKFTIHSDSSCPGGGRSLSFSWRKTLSCFSGRFEVATISADDFISAFGSSTSARNLDVASEPPGRAIEESIPLHRVPQLHFLESFEYSDSQYSEHAAMKQPRRGMLVSVWELVPVPFSVNCNASTWSLFVFFTCCNCVYRSLLSFLILWTSLRQSLCQIWWRVRSSWSCLFSLFSSFRRASLFNARFSTVAVSNFFSEVCKLATRIVQVFFKSSNSSLSFS